MIAKYERKLSIMSLENFLMDYVPKANGGAGKAERVMKKRAKTAEEGDSDGDGKKPPPPLEELDDRDL
eukprot:COSAG05_NODE_357_length_10830_cov_5.181810_5_plen_68_part_00